MGVSVFNILMNMCVIIAEKFYSSGVHFNRKKVEKERMRVIKKRLENLKVINKFSFKSLTYI